MSSALDMSLDDIIKNNKSNTTKDSKPRFRGRGGGGGGGGGGPGPTRRFNNRSANRSNPYAPAPKAPESTWKHDMYSDQMTAVAGAYGGGAGGRAGAIETGTKLYISNLDYGVSNEDIKELFSEVGDLKRFSVHYDRSGRSKGTAEVVFSRRLDAVAAVKRYNNVQLDGKPMKIEIVGTNIVTPPVPQPPQVSNGGLGNPTFVPRSFSGRGGFNGLSRGGGSGGRGRAGGRGRGRGRGGGRAEPASVADLDADLDKYHSEAMQTN